MEKRKLISLRSVLLRYLLQTTAACVLTTGAWLVLLMMLINSGGLLPANRAASVSQEAAQDILPTMTAETFDSSQLDPLCRYVLFAGRDSDEVLVTNMDERHLQWALENWRGTGGRNWGYTQYYMNAELQDGTFCQLQFDYATPYADPALRRMLPDAQAMHLLLGALLLAGVIALCTHRTGKFLARETAKLTAAAQSVADQKLDDTVFTGAKVKEYDAALQALRTMGGELTSSLQRQWAMEQQQREQIIQLSHKLKTPLTIIEGNAELLAEDELTPEQHRQVTAILDGAEQTRTYLGKIRAEVQTPLKYKGKLHCPEPEKLQAVMH